MSTESRIALPAKPGVALSALAMLIGIASPTSVLAQHWSAPAHVEKGPCVISPNPDACATEELQRDFLNVIGEGPKDAALQAISKSKDVNFSLPPYGIRPLSYATQRGRPEIVAALLKKGADPLAKMGPHNVLQLYSDILSVYSSKPEFPPEVVECVRLVLEKADRLGLLSGSTHPDASVVFSHSPRKFSLDLLRVFLKYGADPSRVGEFFYRGKSPLDVAIAEGNLAAVRIMLEAGRRVSQSDLDKRAFDAVVNRKTELLEVLRAGGGDPTRYMKANSKELSEVVRKGGMETLALLLKNGASPDVILFDAVQPEGSIEMLEFLLKNGANPNAVNFAFRTPILHTRDPEKLQLLFKYGADANYRKGFDYTALANILFLPGREISIPSSSAAARKPRIYSKVSLVKLFLDHGADPNADQGGNGLYGALGLTHRGDQEVIDLLIERGATLTYRIGPHLSVPRKNRDPRINKSYGLLTIAIDLLERDDLALALLARDRKVGAEDRGALIAAVRRGWREVSRELLRFGADPNVADEQGITPLAKAERRRDRTLIKALIAAGATPSSKAVPRYKVGGGTEFESSVATEIDEVVFFDPPRFDLGIVNASRKNAFLLYGSGARNQEQEDVNRNLETIQCERMASFRIIARANEAGEINVGICAREAARLRKLAANAEGGLRALLDQLLPYGMGADPKERERGERVFEKWVFERKTGPSRSEIYRFPVIVIGHGVLDAPTVVLVSEREDQAVIVQASVMRLCGEGSTMSNQTPLCSGTQDALTDIARRLFARFSEP